MDIRDLFSTRAVQVPQNGQNKSSVSRPAGVPSLGAAKETLKASVCSDYSRRSKERALKSKTSEGAGGKSSSSLTALPAPYDGASNVTTLEELSRKRSETHRYESDVEIHEDVASEFSAVESHPQYDDEDADDEPNHSDCDDTHSVRSEASARSAKSVGTKSARSVRSSTVGKDTTVKCKRKTPKPQSIALVYEDY